MNETIEALPTKFASSRQILEIPCSKIRQPPPDKTLRSLNRPACQKLAESIREQGLIHPIGVIAHPEDPKLFLVVHGRHRLYAVKKILRWTKISCELLNLNDIDAEYAALAENLFRANLKKPQLLATQKRWFDIHLAKLAAQQPLSTPSDEIITLSSEDAHRLNNDLKPNCHVFAKITKELAEHSGVTERQARRATRIFRTFPESEIQSLTSAGVSESDMEALTRIKDPVKRQEIIERCKEGSDPVTAATEVLGSEDVALQKFRGSAYVQAAKKQQEHCADAEAWFEKNLSEKAKLFSNFAAFKADAIFFYSIMGPRSIFRKQTSKHYRTARSLGKFGPFTHLVHRLLSVMPHSEWALCSHCSGAGTIKNPDGTSTRCFRCRETGYELTLETQF